MFESSILNLSTLQYSNTPTLDTSSTSDEISLVVVGGRWDSRVHLPRMRSSGCIYSMVDTSPVVHELAESGAIIIISSIQKPERARGKSSPHMWSEILV